MIQFTVLGLLDVGFEDKSMGATTFKRMSECPLRPSHGMCAFLLFIYVAN